MRLPHLKVNVGADEAKTALKADSEQNSMPGFRWKLRDLGDQRIHERYSVILDSK